MIGKKILSHIVKPKLSFQRSFSQVNTQTSKLEIPKSDLEVVHKIFPALENLPDKLKVEVIELLKYEEELESNKLNLEPDWGDQEDVPSLFRVWKTLNIYLFIYLCRKVSLTQRN